LIKDLRKALKDIFEGTIQNMVEANYNIKALTPFLYTMEGVNCSMFTGDYLYSMMGYVNNL